MSNLEYWRRRMRDDWDQRALEDAQHYIHTTQSEPDSDGFEESGQANYNQLVRPFLPLYLGGRNPEICTAVEIGCGIGRMTCHFAQDFGSIYALDVSPEMIGKARRRLGQFSNIHFEASDGSRLAGVPDSSSDLVFSYLVFQHIPSAEVVEDYFSEAQRVLKTGGIFKFQVNGDPASQHLEKDTWQGVSFSQAEVEALLSEHDFSIVSEEGLQTQYLMATARKGLGFPDLPTRPYILPGEPWASEQLVSGWGAPVERSWRPVAPVSRARIHFPSSQRLRLYVGIFFWPNESHTGRSIRFLQDEKYLGEAKIEQAGDHFVCFEIPGENSPRLANIEMQIDPPCQREPALRILGVYSPV